MIIKSLAVLLCFVLCCCTQGNDKFVRKTLSDGNISIKWYYFSYITNSSPDFIVVMKDGKEQEIFKAEDVVTDVIINGKKIIIKEYKPERGIVFTKSVLLDVFGYKIQLDSSATRNDYNNTPLGVKE